MTGPTSMHYALELLRATPNATHGELVAVTQWLRDQYAALYDADPLGEEYGGASDCLDDALHHLSTVGRSAEQAEADKTWEAKMHRWPA